MYPGNYPKKRYRITKAFVEQAISKQEKIIDLGVVNPFSEILKKEGYIDSFEILGDIKKDISITLKYYKGSPLINKIEKITKQGCRVYSSVDEIPKTIGGLGTTILSTSKGVMSDADARNQKVGGEVLISVF